MSDFKFIHAADLHLDSPLVGLAGRSADFAARVEAASREAFSNLIDLAIAENCRFMLLAGDIFDGDLRNFQTGLFFVEGMRRLGEAGIDVFMILGNHDSQNRFADKLSLTENVHVFPKTAATSRSLEDVGVTVHGRSYPRWDLSEDIAREYPPAAPGTLNIGVLHTACAGSEGDHARYAPCTPEQLANHGYDYWALGHVHEQAVLLESPYIVYSGNLQGRHAREAGPKGAMLVTVEDGRIATVEHRALDVVRWHSASFDVSSHADRTELLTAMRVDLSQIAQDAEGRPVALRVTLRGATVLHGDLTMNRVSVREDVETLLATLPGDFWLEKLVLSTTTPVQRDEVDPSVAGRLGEEIDRLAGGGLNDALEARLAEIRAKLPAGAHADAFIEQMRREIPARGAALARSLVGGVGHAAD